MYKDSVKCCNCNFYGLLDIGEEDCPECRMNGSLAWKGEEIQEVEI